MTVVRSVRAEASRNERGSAEDRRRRRAWLIETYRADVDVWAGTPEAKVEALRLKVPHAPHGEGIPACRCFRCGRLLTTTTLTVDRIVPGCKGGTYRRDNIRPACAKHNNELGQVHARAARQPKKGRP